MSEFYNKEVFLTNQTAVRLYGKVSGLPIYDYHSHVPPRDIAEDKVFDNIGQMWLSGDHYKWRLMRIAGIAEEYITGGRSYKEKFMMFAKALETAVGNPLYHWSHFELRQYFGIDTPLCHDTAEEIWNRANSVIAQKQLSPKKLIACSNVAYIGTTDDVIDDLSWHRSIKDDRGFSTVVAPSFRTDNLLLIRRDGYAEYIQKLGSISVVATDSLDGMMEAVGKRLDYFKQAGCTFTDVGIPLFPERISTKEEAERIYGKALAGEKIDDGEYHGFIGFMYLFLAAEYAKRELVMQLHIGVMRNCNSSYFNTIGPDCGGDCVGDPINPTAFAALFDRMQSQNALPKTIVYTLNPTSYYIMATVCGAFRGVTLGAAWWFNDHLRGIIEQLNIFAELSNLGTFYGMLSDSRSFLSYPRHDYFRRILCDFVGNKIESGEYPENQTTYDMLEKICCGNIAGVIEG
ncbi:MAG: glucuronate isomerase [Oscillospiraceae bacterium]|nr:glucuronate isomerase [Oscillospiraceae bacterium]